MSEAERHDELSNSKEHCYRSAFLIMFITFPETSSRILRMLPPACQEICQVRGRPLTFSLLFSSSPVVKAFNWRLKCGARGKIRFTTTLSRTMWHELLTVFIIRRDKP